MVNPQDPNSFNVSVCVYLQKDFSVGQDTVLVREGFT